MSHIISIVTPSYNQGKFIAGTIESILSQEGDFYIDYIIVDGKSSDNSVEVMKKYEKSLEENCEVKKESGLEYYVKKNKEFVLSNCLGISYRWLSEKDKGQSDALNKGFRMAKGDLATWLNSDDLYLPDTLKKVSTFFRNNPDAKVAFGGTIAVDDKGLEKWRHMPTDMNKYRMLYNKETVPQPSVFFTMEALKSVGYVNQSLHYTMDTELWLKFLFKGYQLHPINELLSKQIYHPESKSSQGGTLFEKFEPENKKIRGVYKGRLGIRRIVYEYRYFKEKIYLKIKGKLKKILRGAS